MPSPRDMAGLGGLPAPRPDQRYNPPSIPVSVGTSAGIVRARVVIITGGTGSGIFVYSPSPGAGNLIGSWAAQAGTDQYGNAYPQGLNVSVGTLSGVTISTVSTITVGAPGSSEVVLSPNVSQAFNVTTAISGFLQAAAQFVTTDGSEVLPGNLGALLLGTGTATKMSTALISPLGSSTGAAILLEAENDAGTDTAVMTIGTITSPDGGTTVTFTPVVTITPFAFLLYSGASGQTTVTKTSGSGTIPIPVGVTTAKGECWGGGAGGTGNLDAQTSVAIVAGGGPGGEYAQEPALVVPSGGTVAYTVGAAGAAGTGAAHSGNGGNSTLTGSSVTVTAHGATSPWNAPNKSAPPISLPGATGSVNSIHFDGGASAANSISGPGGGPDYGGEPGSSGGALAAGNAGQVGTSTATPAVTGGGPGGTPGKSPNSGSGTAGTAPASGPGGGGGGGGVNFSTGVSANGGPGFAGQVRLTYSSGIPPVLLSVASAAGTDQFGTAYPAGLSLSMAASAGGIAVITNTASAPSAPSVQFTAAAAADRVLGMQVAGDGNFRFREDSNGRHDWGPGSGVVDTNLYRSAANLLKTDDALTVTLLLTALASITVTGAANLIDSSAPSGTSGQASLYSATGRASSVGPDGQALLLVGSAAGGATVNKNTVTSSTEGVLSTVTVVANAAQIGAIWRLSVFGYGTWGSTQQTLQFRTSFAGSDIGDVVTIQNTDLVASATFEWNVQILLACVTTGVSGTWRSSISGCLTENSSAIIPGTAANNTIPFSRGTGSSDVTVDTTANQALKLTASWASTTGGPTITKTIGIFERVA